ncbi:major capsid protein [Capybara microvirus Cap1_SP_90]|nr:major capsid protein [Capybara microvirus Cap1_SP_90]
MNLSSVKIEKESTLKKQKFDLTHDVNTTFNWGELQPLQCRFLPLGDTKSVFNIDSLVRLAPLTAPTFGRMFLKQFHQFVPISDIFPYYNEMLADLPITVTNPSDPSVSLTSRISAVPTISPVHLMAHILEGARFIIYESLQDPTQDTGSDSTIMYSVSRHEYDLHKSEYLLPLFFQLSTQDRAICTNTIQYGIKPDVAIIPSGEVEYEIPWKPEAGDYVYTKLCTVAGVEKWRTYSFRLSSRGKRLRKILLGLGYQPYFEISTGAYDVNVSVLPILAYYKAYWDLFRLPQYDNYEETLLCKMYKSWKAHGSFAGLKFVTGTASGLHSTICGTYLYDLLGEMKDLWYTEEMDYISSHTDGTALTTSRDLGMNIPYQRAQNFPNVVDAPVANGGVFNPYSSDTENHSASGIAFRPGVSGATFTQLDDELLKKMYYWCNKQSNIGYQLREVLTAKGYQSYVNTCTSNYIGSNVVPIEVEAVTSLAETDKAQLGQYAGRGVKGNSGSKFSFTNNEPGYLISMACIVPSAGFNSAVDPTLYGIDRYTIYNPQFDGFGLEPTRRSSVGSTYGVERSGSNTMGDIFGFIPRYSGFKVATNILNGDMSLMSMRDTYYPYQLDRQIIQNNLSTNPIDTGEHTKDASFRFDIPAGTVHQSMPNAGKSWRFPTRYGYLGNFNRIFRNGVTSDQPDLDNDVSDIDNFLSHNVINYSMFANMLPISESWDTIECEDDPDRVINVNK